jgi:hypothetical protein
MREPSPIPGRVVAALGAHVFFQLAFQQVRQWKLRAARYTLDGTAIWTVQLEHGRKRNPRLIWKVPTNVRFSPASVDHAISYIW